MSFSYDSSSVSTTTHKMRLMLGDTDSEVYIFEDEELEAFYGLAGSEIMAAVAMACRTIAVDKAKQAIAYRMLSDAIEIDKTSMPKYFMDLADKLESGLMSEPILFTDSIQYGVDVLGIESGTEYCGDDEL